MLWISRMDRHARLLGRMCDAVGADLRDIAGPSSAENYRAAVLACTGCAEARACADWLDAHPAGGVAPPTYCRNSDRFPAATEVAA